MTEKLNQQTADQLGYEKEVIKIDRRTRKRNACGREVPIGTLKLILQFYFIPIKENSQKAKKSKLEDIACDLHLYVKDVVIAVLICAVLSNNKWIATGNVNKIAAIITIGAIIIYGLFAFDVWLRCRK